MRREIRILARNALEGVLTDRPVSEHVRQLYKSVLIACVIYPEARLLRVLYDLADEASTEKMMDEIDLDFVIMFRRVKTMLSLDYQDIPPVAVETLQIREFPVGTSHVEQWLGAVNPQVHHFSFNGCTDTALLYLLMQRVK